MGLFNNLFRKNTAKQPEQLAINLANRFLDAFKNGNLDEADSLAEDMIERAGIYWNRYDFESYNCLLHAAEETSYMYHGKKYPRDLVEELIRKQRN